LVSSTGLVIAIALIAASCALFYAHNFIHNQVRSQLAAEKITFPAAGSKSLTSLPAADRSQVGQYAGQQLLTGSQAKVFADNYIAAHLKRTGGGKTYSELSTASLANPSDAKLAGQVQTVFRGETLRGLLLNAYAFDTVGMVAYYAGIGALVTAALLVVLSMLGFSHASRAKSRRR
ncbi:MAG TPA: hypothetical protein VFJ84_01490, partial [Candidatus Saccharimonadales bacterium]|nr:hypothetical protein [Candidatus Saccharimonadales bacterium]